jgi:hypothetical protein
MIDRDRLAKETKVILRDMTDNLGLTIVGSGVGGKVLKADLLDALEVYQSVEIPPDHISIFVNDCALSAITITEGPIANQTFEPGQSYDVPASWWRLLREKRTGKGELYFKKE